MNKAFLSLVFVGLLSACAKDSSDGGGSVSGFDNTAPGLFEVLSAEKMTAMGLKESDFYPVYSKDNTLDPRLGVGATQKATYTQQYKNGATASFTGTTRVTSVTTLAIELMTSFTATTSLFPGVYTGSEVRTCSMVEDGDRKKLECDTISKEEPQIPPDKLELIRLAAFCEVNQDSSSNESDTEYGFYTLNGVRLKAIRYKSQTVGVVKCSDDSAPGRGVGNGTFILTSELPNVMYPQINTQTMLFAYSEVVLDSGAVVMKSRAELVH